MDFENKVEIETKALSEVEELDLSEIEDMEEVISAGQGGAVLLCCWK